MNTAIPLIAPKCIKDFSPTEYKSYIEAMYEECPARKAKREANAPRVHFKWTATGKPNVLVSRREPKFVTQKEFELLYSTHKIPQNILFLYLKKRQIEVRPGTDNALTEESLKAAPKVGENVKS